MQGSVDLYNHSYGRFSSAAEEAVRLETYGEDIGQSSWMTAEEWLHVADEAAVRPGSRDPRRGQRLRRACPLSG